MSAVSGVAALVLGGAARLARHGRVNTITVNFDIIESEETGGKLLLRRVDPNDLRFAIYCTRVTYGARAAQDSSACDLTVLGICRSTSHGSDRDKPEQEQLRLRRRFSYSSTLASFHTYNLGYIFALTVDKPADNHTFGTGIPWVPRLKNSKLNSYS